MLVSIIRHYSAGKFLLRLFAFNAGVYPQGHKTLDTKCSAARVACNILITTEYR